MLHASTFAAIALLLLTASSATAYGAPELRVSQASPVQIADLAPTDSHAGRRIDLDIFNDNGLVTEFAVRCGGQRGMVTYSRSEGLFCGPQMRCSTSKLAILSEICRP